MADPPIRYVQTHNHGISIGWDDEHHLVGTVWGNNDEERALTDEEIGGFLDVIGFDIAKIALGIEDDDDETIE